MHKTFALITLWTVALAAPRAVVADRDPDGYPRLMQGPMVGAVTPTSIAVWLRLSGPYEVAVEYGTDPQLRDARRSAGHTVGADTDYAADVLLTDLEPGTRYYYRPLVEGASSKYLAERPPFRTQTAPASRTAPFRVAFGSCARYQEDREQLVWRAVDRLRPDLFLWLGDNVYGDSRLPQFIAEEWRRQRDVANLQPVNWSIPQLAIWDDHDYGLNDHDRTSPIKEQARAVFADYWANPAAGTADCPGVFFEYGYSGVDFFFLDVRTYRSPNADPDGPDKTMLGACQLAWLKERLATSRAPFKVLASGSGWTKAKGPGGDSWAAFLTERDAFFAWLFEAGIEGVVLLSGDTHVGELNAVPHGHRSGYDLYELVSSPLAQDTSGSWLRRDPEVRIRPAYWRGPNFGLLSFKFDGEAPMLRFDLLDWDGRAVQAPLVLRADELRNGVSSWRRHISEELLPLYEQRY